MGILWGESLKLGINWSNDTIDSSLDATLSLQRRLELAINLAQGVKALHERKVVHLDIKPTNIRVDEESHTCHLINFRFACASNLPEYPLVRGPRERSHYTAPEILGNRVAIENDPFEALYNADVWSLGNVIVYTIFDRSGLLTKNWEQELNTDNTLEILFLETLGAMEAMLKEDPGNRWTLDTIITRLANILETVNPASTVRFQRIFGSTDYNSTFMDYDSTPAVQPHVKGNSNKRTPRSPHALHKFHLNPSSDTEEEQEEKTVLKGSLTVPAEMMPLGWKVKEASDIREPIGTSSVPFLNNHASDSGSDSDALSAAPAGAGIAMTNLNTRVP